MPCLTGCPTESSDLSVGLECLGGPGQTSNGGNGLGSSQEDDHIVPSLISDSDPSQYPQTYWWEHTGLTRWLCTGEHWVHGQAGEENRPEGATVASPPIPPELSQW